MALKYIGTGGVIGIPARDLTDEEARRFGGEADLLKIKGSDNLPLYRVKTKAEIEAELAALKAQEEAAKAEAEKKEEGE
jgi:hypothetical protein